MVEPSGIDPATVAGLQVRVVELERRIAALELERRELPPRSPRRRAARLARVADTELETVLGLTWFNRVGAIIVVIGLALAALWANDRGYLTPLWRNLLGAMVAVTVFAIGARAVLSRESGRRGFGIGVTMVGGFGLYLVPITASRVDAVLPPSIATALLVGITVTLALLAARRRCFVFAALGLTGGMVLPVFADPTTIGGGLWFGYLGLLWIGFVALQHRRRWPALDLIGSAGLSLHYAAWLAAGPTGGPLAAVGALLWAGHLASEGLRRRAGVPARPMVLLGVALLGGAGILIVPALSPALRVALLVALYGGQVYLWRESTDPRALFALAAAACFALVSMVQGELPGLSALSLVAIASAGVTLPLVALYLRRAALDAPLGDQDHALAGAATLLGAVPWLSSAVAAGQPTRAALPLSLLAVLWLGAGVWLSRERRGRAAIGWCYNLSGLVAAVTAVLALRATGMPWATLSLWATVVTTGLALTLVAVGVGGGHPASRMVGLGLLAAALLKLLVLDLWTLGAGTRIGVLLALGVGLLAASFLYGRYTDHRPGPGEPVDLDEILVPKWGQESFRHQESLRRAK